MKAFAFIPICRPSTRGPEASESLRNLGLKDVSLENRLEVRNEGGKREIILIGAVGASYWDDSGITEKEFRNALAQFPKGSGNIDVLVNSEGGSVQEGLGIYNAIKERASEITAKITGYALSIASVFPLAAGRVISPKSAIWMTHKAWSYAQGNDDDMDAAARMLREHNKTLAEIYAKETGKTVEEWEGWMKAETWIRGSKAIEYGLADETDESDAKAEYRPFHPDFAQRCKSLSPEILNAISASGAVNKPNTTNTKEELMNRNEMLALARSWGHKVSDDISDADLKALVLAGKPQASEPTVSEKRIAALEEINAREIRNRLTLALDKIVADNRMTPSEALAWLPRVTADETILVQLQAWPQRPVAAEPIGPESIEVGASVQDFAKAIRRCDEPTKAWQRGSSVKMETIKDSAVKKAGLIHKMRKNLAGGFYEVFNTNTIDSTLKRDVILQAIIVDFARRTLPLNLFSTVFSNVPLEGTNKVQVPFYDLDSSASQVFAAATGYDTIGNTTTDNREITVGTGATDGGRWYQGLAFSSEEMARQPYLKIEQLARLKAEKLASDIVADVLSVITAANYGAAAKTEGANAFDSDDIADMKLACKLWPEGGRSLFLDSAYDANLLKDPAFKSALNAASDSAIKEGKLFPRVMGFDYVESPTIPANGENLVGFAAFASAILVAFAPVPPVAEVRNAGVTYQMVVDPTSGAMFEYRTFGNVVLDSATHTIESSFGWAKGNGNALKRITSA